MSFNTIRENKILTKISQFTVFRFSLTGLDTTLLVNISQPGILGAIGAAILNKVSAIAELQLFD